ncbi:unnamed protein product [Tilletia caries]|nr:hypothetical protein CF328_g5912 [Tilletia controversa]KAE8192407.1 hypothetical protein CF336_g4442 [Tilletia laevis]KAE8262245.1 hypothetical protein A4X03_0g2606 [Tilletia caries]CAD6892531.1 unnamed protein product [Tilletia caries]CAD6914588.1 unnamed protein product [Tilletia controversa]
MVVCISSPEDASRLQALLNKRPGAADATSQDGLESDEESDNVFGNIFASESSLDKGQWKDWTPPVSDSPSQVEGESISELIRHAQQIIFKRNSGYRPVSKLSGQNVLTLGYRPADVRSDTIRVARMGGAPTTLANFYVNTNVTQLTTGIEWQALLNSVGAKVFVHLLIATSLFQAVPDSSDCLVQICGKPLHELPELSHASLKPTVSEEPPVAGAEKRGKKRKRRRSRANSTVATVAVPSNAALVPAQGRALFPRSMSRQSFGRVSSAASFNGDYQSLPADFTFKAASKGSKGLLYPTCLRKPSEIAFVRPRLFYARPLRSKQGKVHIGLPFLHSIVRSAEPKILVKMTTFSSTQEARITKVSKSMVTKPSHPVKVAAQRQLALRVRHILKYMFPRQFGLHNVFTSVVDRNLTTQAFPDYTMREAEIRLRGRCKTPKRVMTVRGLVKTMLRRIDAFDFKRTLDRCCPSRIPRRRLTQVERAELAADLSEVHPSNMASQVQKTMEASQVTTSEGSRSAHPPRTQAVASSSQDVQSPSSPLTNPTNNRARIAAEKQAKEKPRFYKYAVSTGQVSHFAYVVLKSIIPHGLLGSRHNLNVLLQKASQFIKGRRYESLTLHEVMQGIRISEVDWLLPVNGRAQQQRPTAVESQLRNDLFAELVYWIFDSLLIPLLRTTFYITESAAFRNRTLYFRQDDWATASAPLLDTLKTSLFTPITHREALQIMSGRNLGYSHIRLLPKEAGVRPIVNLRRRSVKQTQTGDSKAPTPGKNQAYEKYALNRSINNILQSTFHILTYERSSQPDLMGASVFGMNDIFRRLKDFQRQVFASRKGSARPHLYFVKVDVQAAFDTIEQGKLLAIVRKLLTGDDYLIQRFTEVMPTGGKIKKNYMKRACLETEHGTFLELAQDLANSLRHVIFVDGVVYAHEERRRVLTLLEQHIEGNLVKIGREFFKQKIGIPQGSSLSTLLCSVFYADMERSDPDLLPIGTVTRQTEQSAPESQKEGSASSKSIVSLLMRYTDDFLFISTSRRKAKAFFKTMLKGHPEYGCFISPGKTLANFDLFFPDGGFVPRVRERTVKRRRPGAASNSSGQYHGAGDRVNLSSSKVVRIGAQLSWCGVFLNTVDLSVSSDLTRYHHDLHIADTLTVETGRKPGATLVSKLLQSIQSRSHLILLDTGLNGDVGAHINIYHTCLLAALKVLVYARLVGVDPLSRSEWMLDTLKRAATYQYTTIAARVKHAFRAPRAATNSSSYGPNATLVQCSLKQSNVKWLALHAFRRVLSTRSAQWHAVVRGLDDEVAAVRPGRGTARWNSTLLGSKGKVTAMAASASTTASAAHARAETGGSSLQGSSSSGDAPPSVRLQAAVRAAPGRESHDGVASRGERSHRAGRMMALLRVPEQAMAMGGAELLANARY